MFFAFRVSVIAICISRPPDDVGVGDDARCRRSCYNPCVLKLAFIFMLALTTVAQQAPKKDATQGKPPVRVNYLNVCAPSEEEQAVLKGALGRIATRPSFDEDFEISRGRTTLKDAPSSKYVRLRRDFPAQSSWMTAQYSMATDANSTVEILVLRPRDPKEFLQVEMEDSVSSAAAPPLTVLATDTPPVRIRIERLTKGAVALSRCEGADQSAYEPIFKQMADVMALYRASLGMRTAFRSDIAWLGGTTAEGAKPQGTKPSGTKTGRVKKAASASKKQD
jgi:hypothetical protein